MQRSSSTTLDFGSATPSVVKSIRQRDLLNVWLRAARAPGKLPMRADFMPECLADELADMMGFAVEGEGDGARFFITQEGTRLATAYGNDHMDPAQRIHRYLDDAIGPERYARVAPCYLTCIGRRRPTYSIATVRDADGKDVSFERLLLPFGSNDRVEEIVGSLKAISIEGGFQIRNLMGVRAKAVPVRLLNAVIDRDIAGCPAGVRVDDGVVELN